jgi:tetratricopeptide (TPR) repeat protein
MLLRLESWTKKLGVIALVAAASVPFALSLQGIVRAEQLSRRGTAESLIRAIALQPGNARLHNQLGRVLLFSPESDSRAAENYLQRATQLDPTSGDYFTDLAMSREMHGDLAGAQDALERARRAEPHTPLMKWHAMNFFLRRGEVEKALTESAGLLRGAPEYTVRVVPVIANAVPMNTVIERVVPDEPRVLCDLLAVISRTRDHAGASRAWDRVVRSGFAFRPVCIEHFLNALIVSGESQLAQRVWRDSLERRWLGSNPESLSEPFYNADFRYPVLNSGFDWRVVPHAEASAWIESQGPEVGQQSLCVQFNSDARIEYANIVRYIPVQPNTEYSMRARIRSDRLDSSPGAFLQLTDLPGVVDASGKAVYTRSESWSGTNRWKEISLRVTTGSKTQLLVLQLRRPGVLATDRPASGTTCISAVEWRALGATPTRVEIAKPEKSGGTP